MGLPFSDDAPGLAFVEPAVPTDGDIARHKGARNRQQYMNKYRIVSGTNQVYEHVRKTEYE